MLEIFRRGLDIRVSNVVTTKFDIFKSEKGKCHYLHK